jgi:hypothetical protein
MVLWLLQSVVSSAFNIGFGGGYAVYRHFQQYFSYIVAVSFIDE